MLATFILDPISFRSVQERLLSSHFSGPEDRPLAVVWAACKQFYRDHQQLPTVPELEAEVHDRLHSDEPLDEDEVETLNCLFDLIDGLRPEELNPTTAQQYAVRLLSEHLFAETQDLLRGEVVVDLPALLETQAIQARSIQSLSTSGASDPISIASLDDLGVRPPAIAKVTTGCPFLDHFMGGGQAAKEVYGVAAPYGVCKTTLAIQLVVERAKWEQARWLQESRRGSPPRVYLATYEETKESLEVRILSNWSGVDRRIIEEGRVADLSTSTNLDSLKPYERVRYRDALERGAVVLGERERLEAAIRAMSSTNPLANIGFFDFTGADTTLLPQGAEMAAGLANVIARDQAKYGNPGVSMVVVDHANAAAECRMDFHNLDPSREKRHLVGNFPKSLKQNIAAPFMCPVWVMHQLNTSAQDKGMGILPKITDFAEAKNFGEYCDYVFLIGAKNAQDLCILLNAKQRRTEKRAPTVIHVDGMLCRVEETGSLYRIDNCRIVPARDYSIYSDDADLGSDMDDSRASLIQGDDQIGL